MKCRKYCGHYILPDAGFGAWGPVGSSGQCCSRYHKQTSNTNSLAMILRGPFMVPDAATVPEFCKVVFNLDLRSQTTKPPSQAWFAAHGF